MPWVPVLTSDIEFSVLIETSLWLLQPPWLEKKNKTKNGANTKKEVENGDSFGAKSERVSCGSGWGTNWFMQRSNY